MQSEKFVLARAAFDRQEEGNASVVDPREGSPGNGGD